MEQCEPSPSAGLTDAQRTVNGILYTPAQYDEYLQRDRPSSDEDTAPLTVTPRALKRAKKVAKKVASITFDNAVSDIFDDAVPK